jgi:hypothetical protein
VQIVRTSNPAPAAQSAEAGTIRQIETELAALVAERQALREAQGSRLELERNRRSIVGYQRELTRALGAFYGAGEAHPPPADAKAA